MNRPIQATIVTQNLKENLFQVRNFTNQSHIWAVIKANAYGHSIAAAFQAFSNADGLALLDLNDALQLRSMGWSKKILLLEGIFSPQELSEVIQSKTDMVVHQFEQLAWIENYLSQLSQEQTQIFLTNVEIWLKLNSGMNRLGFKSGEYAIAYHHLKQFGFTVNHMTHFANADTSEVFPTVPNQWAIFQHATQWMEGARSAANSSAILNYSEVHADWVRPGVILYGASPTGRYEDIAHLPLKPGMILTSEIIGIQEIAAGETVGYGSQFVAKKNTRVGIVACGYADGYPRHARDGTPVWVASEGSNNAKPAGSKVGLIGRVSMDMITIDVTDLPDAKIGSKVELWGNHVPIDDVAMWSNTIGYELMCSITQRVKMVIA